MEHMRMMDLGYDRGHLSPSADFRWSAQALSESLLFQYVANVSRFQ
ncbi:MAG: DNA/RNA non-specific endonuclease [Saprospiraceae bacterium]|nr:DNA/RNA non-specific endonuclease [Saprospiraceae bacterium]